MNSDNIVTHKLSKYTINNGLYYILFRNRWRLISKELVPQEVLDALQKF